MTTQKSRIGILWLHGIGEQCRAQTLVEYGDPLYDFVEKWYAGSSGIRVEMNSSSLAENDENTPAHASFSVIRDDGESEEWLMAESHWVESFPKPSATAVTEWLMKVVPWVWVSFLARRVRWAQMNYNKSRQKGLVWARIVQGFNIIGYLILTCVLSPMVLLAEVVLFFLLILDPLPIKIIQDTIATIQQAISSVLGDSYIFTSSNISREAVTKKIQDDIQWLADRCEHLVVMAHSQGAALAYLTLKKRMPANLRILVTYGSGIQKLTQLNRLKSRKIALVGNMYAIGALYFTMLMLHLSRLMVVFANDDLVDILLFTASIPVLAFLALWTSMEEDVQDVWDWGATHFSTYDRVWLDVFSNWDPVPNGPIFINKDAAFISTVVVQNENSIFRDHVTYQRNPEQFYHAVVGMITNANLKISKFESPISRPVTAPIKEKIMRVREGRIMLYRLDKMFLVVAAFLALLDSHKVIAFGDFVGHKLANIFSSGGATWNYSGYVTGIGSIFIAWIICNLLLSFMVNFTAESTMRNFVVGDRNIGSQAELLSYLTRVGSATILFLAIQIHYPVTLWFSEWFGNPGSWRIVFQTLIAALIFGAFINLIETVRRGMFLKKHFGVA